MFTACSSFDKTKINNQIVFLSSYPNCDYIVLDIIKIRNGKELNNVYSNVASPLSMRVSSAQGNKQEAIEDLLLEASKLEADAIAVVKYENIQKLISTNMAAKAIVLNHYYYTAQAIKMCEEAPSQSINTVKRKPVNYLIDGTYNL
jgi:hypothetical protein